MEKIYTALGLMSGTSMDGVDVSVINSDGNADYLGVFDQYFEYNKELYQKLINLRDKIINLEDLKINFKEIKLIEREITLFHAEVVNQIVKTSKINFDFIGFHGQTIFHNPENKITKQLGDGKLLSQLTKKIVVYDFRQNDLINGGQGAPLAPIFHHLIINKKKIKIPITIFNIGGIANITSINKNNKISSLDIGPGNCLIDAWIRLNSKLHYDINGNIAKKGKINKILLDQSLDNFYSNKISKKKSFDINDFDISFVRGLSLEDGAATLTEFTAEICSNKIKNHDIYVCGGGRKNKFLLERIKKKINSKIELIDKIGINGDFIESQSFAYLAIRSYLKLPISFPETTGCIKPSTGGVIVKNF